MVDGVVELQHDAHESRQRHHVLLRRPLADVPRHVLMGLVVGPHGEVHDGFGEEVNVHDELEGVDRVLYLELVLVFYRKLVKS